MPKGSEQAYNTPSNGGFNRDEVTKGFRVLERPEQRTPASDPQFRDSILKQNVRDHPKSETGNNVKQD